MYLHLICCSFAVSALARHELRRQHDVPLCLQWTAHVEPQGLGP